LVHNDAHIERYVEAFGAAGGVTVPLEEAWLRYRQQLPAALMMWTPTHAPLAIRTADRAGPGAGRRCSLGRPAGWLDPRDHGVLARPGPSRYAYS
jgi:hypothetical protein